MIDQPLNSDLIDAVRSEMAILVAGPDLSELAGLPALITAMQKPAEEIGIYDQALTIPEIADYYTKSHPNAAGLLERQIKKRIDVQGRFKDNHLLLKDLPFSTIMTTNFDLLFEQSFAMPPAKAITRIVAGEHINTWNDSAVHLIKLLGSIDHPGSLVITSAALNTYKEHNLVLVNHLKDLALVRPFIFLGFALQRYEFRWLWELIGDTLARSGKSIYIVTQDLGNQSLDFLPKDSVHIIQLDTSPSQITDFLRTLSDKVKGLTSNSTVYTKQIINTSATPADQEKQDIMDNLLNNRLGTWLSLRIDPRAIDNIHHYEIIARDDLLDYEVGDFYSIRLLRGINVSDGLSSSLVYAESSEVKLHFAECNIQAVDANTGDLLAVEPLSEEFGFTHIFRIIFPYPLAPGERFDIQYAIRLPGELRALPTQGDAMSMSLARFLQGIDVLKFSVVLNKRPRAYWIEELTPDYKREVSKTRLQLEEIAGTINKIPWSSEKAWRLQTIWENPTVLAYFIRYRFQ